MPAPDDKIIAGFPQGGPDDYGHAIRFELQYATGLREFFYCRADLFQKFLAALNGFGGMAARMRAATPGSLIELATTVKMTTATRTGQFQDGSIALEFGTDLGFPMQVSMTKDQAQRTIALLQAELRRPPPQVQEN